MLDKSDNSSLVNDTQDYHWPRNSHDRGELPLENIGFKAMKDISEDIDSNTYKDCSNLNASNTKPTGKRPK
jgi:hypothetical protein